MPSSSSGVRRTAACAQKAGHRRQVRAAAAAQQCDRVGQHLPGAKQRIAHRGGLARPARVVDSGPETDHGNGLGVRQRRHQRPLPRWCFRFPCRRRSAGRRRRRPPRRRSACPPRWPRVASSCGRARPRRRYRRCPAAPCARRSARQRVRIHRQVRDPHRRAGDAGQRVDRRAAGVDVGDHLGGHFRRVGRHPGPRRHRGHRRTPPPGRARIALAGNGPGTTRSRSTGPRAGPARPGGLVSVS